MNIAKINTRKLRRLYRQYLFSYTFDVIDPLPLPAFIQEPELSEML